MSLTRRTFVASLAGAGVCPAAGKEQAFPSETKRYADEAKSRELKERTRQIVLDVRARKAAIEEGVVPGGGVALLRAQAHVLDRA